jgi:hypothetical protein
MRGEEIPMLRMRAWLGVGLFAAAFMAPLAAQQPLPQHERLAAMAGKWNVEMTAWYKPGAAGVTTRGTSTIESIFNKLFIQEKIETMMNGEPLMTLSLTGFNPATLKYEATRYSNTSPARIVETGEYDEAKKLFELKAAYEFSGSTWQQRTVIRMDSPDTMVATSYVSFNNVPEWKAVEIKYRRQGK